MSAALLLVTAHSYAQGTNPPDPLSTASVQSDVSTATTTLSKSNQVGDSVTSRPQVLPRPTMSLPTTVQRIGAGWVQRFSLIGMSPDEFYRSFVTPQLTDLEEKELKARNHFFLAQYFLAHDEAAHALGEFRAALEFQPDNVYLMLGVADALIAKRSYDEALTTVDDVLKKSPQNVAALILKGKILSGMAQDGSGTRRKELQEQGVAAFQEVKRLQPRNLEALNGLANLYIMQQNVDRMVETYREILLAEPRNTRAMLILAQVLSRTGRTDEAIAFYERVIEQRRGFINTYVYLGQLYDELGRTEDALSTYETAVLIEPRNPQLLRMFDEAIRKVESKGGEAAAMDRYKKFADRYPHSSEVQRIYAEQLIAAKDMDKALTQYQHVLELDPENVEAMVAVGNILLNRKKYDEATELFSKAVDLNPDRVEIYDAIAQTLINRKEPARAIAMYEKALALNPKAEKLYVSLASLYEKDENTTDVIRVLKTGIDRTEGAPELLMTLGVVFEKNRDFGQAADYYERALQKAPENRVMLASLLNSLVRSGRQQHIPVVLDQVTSGTEADRAEVMMLAGEFLLTNGEINEAVQYFEKAIDASPGKLPPYIRLARTLSLQKKYDEALALVNRAIPLFRGSDDLRQLEAEIYNDRGDHNRSIEIYRRMVEDKPDSLDAHRLLIDGLSAAGRSEESLAAVKQAEQRLGKSEEVDSMRGVALYQMKRYDAAEKIFRDLARRSARNADTYYYFLGSIAMEQKKFDTARKHLEKAIELNPTNDSALNALGYMLADQGKELDEAKKLIEQALLLNPGAPHILDSMGWVYFKMGDNDLALEYVQRAAALIGEDPEVYEHLGDIYRARGETATALDYWRKSIALDKERISVQVKIKAVESKEPK
ncbi:hypothetical protein CVU37_02110 [candidate division BRC1 bacterium HGW-BRC1-1]|jgi:tetratricopeptide (TPR) repeat protein|nr:MAG: hypothetical protein CVU37_02110 [candidate division BRC1 bacterium HGW-BRC1-1]